MTQRDEWRQAFEQAPTRDVDAETMSGVPLEPVYGPDDGAFPGQYPYTRGPYASMYRSKLWTMRMFAGFGTAEDTNRRFHEILASGGDGLSTAFDLPTLMGRDSDDPVSEGEVGRCGVAVDSAADMEVLFDGIPLGEITTSMTISGPAAMVFAMWLVVAERQGVPWSRLEGTLQTDILKEYIAQKEWIYPPQPHLRLTADLMAFCRDKVPKYHPVSISGYHIREAGSTAAQELAFTLASGFAHVELGVRAGMAPDEVASRASFFFNSHIDFFEEIAKFRAARRLWARWMRTRYGCTDEQSLRLRFPTQTAGCSLTAQQPYNNVVRTAYEALAAVRGGTQSLHTNSLDEVLALPTEEAAELALRTQQILAYETGAGNVIDPPGGSYFVEALTHRVESHAERSFARSDEMGDRLNLAAILQALQRGYFQAEIADAAYRYQRLVEQGRKVVVGVNRFQRPAREGEINVLQIPPGTEDRQIEDLRARRGARDAEAVREALAALVAAAEAPAGNLMWPLIACARAECTL